MVIVVMMLLKFYKKSSTLAQLLEVLVDPVCKLLECLECPSNVAILVVHYPSTIFAINIPASIVVAAQGCLGNLVVMFHQNSNTGDLYVLPL